MQSLTLPQLIYTASDSDVPTLDTRKGAKACYWQWQWVGLRCVYAAVHRRSGLLTNTPEDYDEQKKRIRIHPTSSAQFDDRCAVDSRAELGT
jgi:hypothetical protein